MDRFICYHKSVIWTSETSYRLSSERHQGAVNVGMVTTATAVPTAAVTTLTAGQQKEQCQRVLTTMTAFAAFATAAATALIIPCPSPSPMSS